MPVREQDPKVRAHNFEEVSYGYNKEEAMLEASRCLHCKNPMCVTGCPVNIQIPEFISHIVEGDIDAAAAVIVPKVHQAQAANGITPYTPEEYADHMGGRTEEKEQ